MHSCVRQHYPGLGCILDAELGLPALHRETPSGHVRDRQSQVVNAADWGVSMMQAALGMQIMPFCNAVTCGLPAAHDTVLVLLRSRGGQIAQNIHGEDWGGHEQLPCPPIGLCSATSARP